jgi:proline dehydrogenase
LQAYLKRTLGDCEEFAASGADPVAGRLRRTGRVAYCDCDDVNDSYLRLGVDGGRLPDGGLTPEIITAVPHSPTRTTAV